MQCGYFVDTPRLSRTTQAARIRVRFGLALRMVIYALACVCVCIRVTSHVIYSLFASIVQILFNFEVHVTSTCTYTHTCILYLRNGNGLQVGRVQVSDGAEGEGDEDGFSGPLPARHPRTDPAGAHCVSVCVCVCVCLCVPCVCIYVCLCVCV
jgi:hypothetical protein